MYENNFVFIWIFCRKVYTYVAWFPPPPLVPRLLASAPPPSHLVFLVKISHTLGGADSFISAVFFFFLNFFLFAKFCSPFLLRILFTLSPPLRRRKTDFCFHPAESSSGTRTLLEKELWKIIQLNTRKDWNEKASGIVRNARLRGRSVVNKGKVKYGCTSVSFQLLNKYNFSQDLFSPFVNRNHFFTVHPRLCFFVY